MTPISACRYGKSFDVDLNLGIFGLKLNDGFIDFDAGVEIGLEGEFSTASLLAGDGVGSIDVGLGGGGDYAVYLPIELGGALDGLNDNQAIMSAFSSRHLRRREPQGIDLLNSTIHSAHRVCRAA